MTDGVNLSHTLILKVREHEVDFVDLGYAWENNIMCVLMFFRGDIDKL